MSRNVAIAISFGKSILHPSIPSLLQLPPSFSSFSSHVLQTNLKNNNNKFYLIQLLEEDKRRAYSVWFRWGRGESVEGSGDREGGNCETFLFHAVGKTGQHNLEEFGSNLIAAKETFKKK